MNKQTVMKKEQRQWEVLFLGFHLHSHTFNEDLTHGLFLSYSNRKMDYFLVLGYPSRQSSYKFIVASTAVCSRQFTQGVLKLHLKSHEKSLLKLYQYSPCKQPFMHP